MAVKTNYEKNGNQYYRVTTVVGKDASGKLIRKEFYGKSKKEAESKKDEFLKGIQAGLTTDYKEMNLSQLMHLWLFEVVKAYASDSTFDRYEGVYRNYVANTSLSLLIVSDIKPLVLQVHYNNLFENGVSSSKIFTLNKILKTFFQYAVTEGYVLRNPCLRAMIPKDETKSIDDIEDDDSDVDPFSEDEIKQISKNIKPSLRMLFELALGTGLRKGELLALTEKDIDLDNKELKVTKTLRYVKKIKKDGTHEYVTIVKPPKTKNSIRTVPIPSNLIMPLKKHILLQKEKYICNGEQFQKSSLIFTTEGCVNIDGSNLLRAWERTLKRADVRYRKFHNIRHTYATKLFEANVNLKTVSMLLGHANIGITADIYTHVMPKEKENAVDKLNHLFAY